MHENSDMALEREVHRSAGAATSEALPGREAEPTTGHDRRRYLLARARAEGHVGVTDAAQDLKLDS